MSEGTHDLNDQAIIKTNILMAQLLKLQSSQRAFKKRSCAIIYISMYALQATHLAILVEGDYPVETTGTVAMPLMIIGYSGEIFMPIVAGACLDHWCGTDGYKVLFTILLGLTIVGLITAIIWQRVTKEKRIEISLLKREMKAC